MESDTRLLILKIIFISILLLSNEAVCESSIFWSDGEGDAINCPLQKSPNTTKIFWKFEQFEMYSANEFKSVKASQVSDAFIDVGDGRLVLRSSNFTTYENQQSGHSNPKFMIFCEMEETTEFGLKLVTSSKKFVPMIRRKLNPEFMCHSTEVGGIGRCCLQNVLKAMAARVEVKFYRKKGKDWQLISDSLNAASRKFVIFSHGYNCLHILNADTEDASYTYKAMYSLPGKRQQWLSTEPKTLSVSRYGGYYARPLSIAAVVTVNFLKHPTFLLPCPSRSTVQWFKENRQLSEGITTLSEHSGDISVTVKGRQTSSFECRAGGDLVSKVTLVVYVPLTVSMDEVKPQPEIDSNFTIRCMVEGWPFRRILWLRNGREVVNTSRVTVRQDLRYLIKYAYLDITMITVHDTGVYQCVAWQPADFTKSCVPHDYATDSVKVIVKISPPSLKSPSPTRPKADSFVGVDLRNGGDVSGSLSCEFEASPAPTIRVSLDGDESLFRDFADSRVFELRTQRSRRRTRVTVKYKVSQLVHTGMLKVQAVTAYGTADCSFQLVALLSSPALLVRQLQPEQDVLNKKPFHLDCYVLGGVNKFESQHLPEHLRDSVQQYNLHWYILRGSHKVTLPLDHNNQVGVEGMPNRLVFTKMSTDLNGRYTCQAENSESESHSSTRLHVRKGIKPVNLEDDINLDRTHTITGSCNVQHLPTGNWYAWWTFINKDGVEEALDDKSVVSYADQSSSAMVDNDIYCVRQPDRYNEVPNSLRTKIGRPASLQITYPRNVQYEGTFVCKIISCFDRASVSKVVKFRREYEFRPNLPPNEVEFVEGTFASITCALRELGPHMPRLTWYSGSSKSDTPVTDRNDHRVSQFPNGTLYIRNVTTADKAFLCITVNAGASTKSKVVHIKVKKPAKVLPFVAERLELIAGSTQQVECRVEGANAKVKWLGRYELEKDRGWCEFSDSAFGRAGEFDEDVTACSLNTYIHSRDAFSKPASISVKDSRFLVFTNVNKQVEGSFRCRASNQYNKKLNTPYSEREFQVQVIQPPGPVTLLQVTDKDHRSVRLQWDSPKYNGNKPIKKYIITFVNPMNQVELFEVPESETSKKIGDLQPGYKYTFNVSAVNDVGRGAGELIDADTKELAPTGQVRGITARPHSSSSILVQWRVPDLLKQNGEIIKYSVEYRVLSPSTDCTGGEFLGSFFCDKSIVVVGEGETFLRHCTGAKPLRADTRYQVRVRPFNLVGPGPAACADAKTLESGPHSPPRSPECSAVNSTSIIVKWRSPSLDSLNGKLSSYQVQFLPTRQAALLNESAEHEVTTNGATSVTIAGLLAFTNYTFTVTVSNDKGRSCRTKPQVCRTKAGMPQVPQQVKVFGINSTHSVATWLPPNQTGGHLIGYDVIRTVIGSANHSQVRVTDTRYMLGHLLPETKYKLKVRAVNHVLYGDFAEAEFSTEALPPTRIISRSQKFSVKKGDSVTLNCEVTGNADVRRKWTCSSNDPPSFDKLSNGSITITNVKTSFSFNCSIQESHSCVQYSVNVMSDGEPIPVSPELLPGQQTSSSLEILWRIRGTKGGNATSAKVQKFQLEYKNLYTGKSYKRNLAPDNRSHLVDPVQCGASVEFRVKVSTGLWSDASKPVTMKAIGTQPKLSGQSATVLGRVTSHSAEFNFSSILPGNGCYPTKYFVHLTADGNQQTSEVSRDKLIDSCCTNISNSLIPGIEYSYRIIAHNAAGNVTLRGSFRTQPGKQMSVEIGDSTTGWSVTELLMIGVAVVVGVFLLLLLLLLLLPPLFKDESAPTQGGRRVTVRVRDGRALPAEAAEDPAAEHDDYEDDNESVDSRGQIKPYCTAYNPAALPYAPGYSQGKPTHLNPHLNPPLNPHLNPHLLAHYAGRNASNASSTDHELYRAWQQRRLQEFEDNSGSSGTTDPGIVRFTNRPPDANELRNGACEVPAGNADAHRRPLTRQMSAATSRTYDTIDPPRQRNMRYRTASDTEYLEDPSYYTYNCNMGRQQQMRQHHQYMMQQQQQLYQQYATHMPDRNRARAQRRREAEDAESRQRLLYYGRIPQPIPAGHEAASQNENSSEDLYDNNVLEV